MQVYRRLKKLYPMRIKNIIKVCNFKNKDLSTRVGN